MIRLITDETGRVCEVLNDGARVEGVKAITVHHGSGALSEVTLTIHPLKVDYGPRRDDE